MKNLKLKSLLKEEKADKDYDKDGKIETPSAEYKGSVDKAIKGSMKEGRGTGPISKLVRDKYGRDVLNAVYELEETLLSVGAFKNEIDNIADIVFEILDAAYDEGYYDGSKSPESM